jgi:hypothetical protein
VKRLAYVLIFVAWLNGCSFFIHDSMIGGSAHNGKIENGRYYVGSHGRYTEVSSSTWKFSWWHEWSAVFSTFVFLLLGIFVATEKRREKRQLPS